MGRRRSEIDRLPPVWRDMARSGKADLDKAQFMIARAMGWGWSDQRLAFWRDAETRATKRIRGALKSGLAELAEQRRSPRPSLARAEIRASNGEVISRPEGALAVRIWRIDINPALRQVGAQLAAVAHEAAACGVKVVDPARIRVDGSPKGEGPAERQIWLMDWLRAAHQALSDCAPMEPAKEGGPKPISAEAIVVGVCVHDLSICKILRAHGWSNGGHSKARARDLLEVGLQAVRDSCALDRAA